MDRSRPEARMVERREMESHEMHRPLTCPIGFSFTWDGDCPGQPARVWTFVGRGELGMPRFDAGDGPVWSMRLEAVAESRWIDRQTVEALESYRNGPV